MRWAFLLIGFAAGLALGFLWKEEPADRTRRAASTPTSTAASADRRAAAREEPEPRPPVPRAGEEAARVVVPSGPMAGIAEEEWGLLVVDFTGFDGDPVAYMASYEITGSREDDELSEEGAELVPGVYEVWWLRGPRRFGVRARVVAGQVTRIRAADHDTLTPPDGLGVLGLAVQSSWGKPLAGCAVGIASVYGGTRQRLNASGCASVTLRPGAYRVRLGDYVSRPVAVRAGRETVLEIAHENQGDLLFDPPEFSARVRRVDTGRQRKDVSALGAERVGYLYLEAGEWEVFLKEGPSSRGGTALGRVRIVPGTLTRFRVERPAGGIRVALEGKFSHRRVTATSAAGYYDVLFVPRNRTALFRALRPGLYKVTCGTATQEVKVDGATERVVLRR